MARWTEKEEHLMRELYPITDNKTLSERLGRSMTSVECKASRMGLKKETTREIAKIEEHPSSNPLVMITREQTMELDKIELLRLIWSLALMYRRELANPCLTKAERHKLMNALSNHTSIVNNILKGAEDELGEGEEDLEAKFIEITRETPARVKARRVIVDLRRKQVVLK
ncbi:MAG: hypothetical protein NWE79_02825 [Candidatus Bathyarchaeota archaeon]|nr:hypothetical protein [Candidatus Bathyarchaeota archaeon]